MANMKKTFELAFAIGGSLSPSFKAAHNEAASEIAKLSKKSAEAMKLNKLQKDFDNSLKDFTDKANKMGAAWGKVVDSIVGPLKQIAIVGSVAGAAVYGLAYKTAKMGDDAVKGASKMGVTTQQFSEMAYAATQSGMSVEQFSGNMGRLNKIVSDSVKKGVSEVYVNNKRLMSLRDENKNVKDRTRLLIEASDAFKKLTDENEKFTFATMMFGKSGADMIPMLEQGGDAIRKMMNDADRLGIVFDDLAGQKASAFIDSWGELKAAAQGLSIAVGQQLHEPLTRVNQAISGWIVANRELIAQKVKEFVQDIIKWVKENKEGIIGLKNSIVEAIHQFGKWIEKNGGLVEVLKKVGKAFIAFKALGIVLAIMNAVGATAIFAASMVTLILQTKALLAAFGGFKAIAALLGGLALPVLAVVAAVASLGTATYLLIKNWEGVVYFFKNLGTTVPIFINDIVEDIKGLFGRLPGWIQNILTPLKNIILSPIQAVQALLAGDIKGFIINIGKFILGKLTLIPSLIATTGNEIIKTIFGIDILGAVKEWITPTLNMLSDTLDVAIDTVKNFFASGIEFIKGFFMGEVMGIKDSFSNGFFNGIKDVFIRLYTLIPRLLNDVVKAITGIDLIATGKAWIQKFIDGVLSVIKGAAGAVTNAVKSLIPDSVLNVLGGVTKTVSGAVSAVGGAAKAVTNALPLRKFGSGGIATEPSLVAEDGKPEMVIPLTKPKRAAELIRQVAPELPELQVIKAAAHDVPEFDVAEFTGPKHPDSPTHPIVPPAKKSYRPKHPYEAGANDTSKTFDFFKFLEDIPKPADSIRPKLNAPLMIDMLDLKMPNIANNADKNGIGGGTFNFSPNINITANGGDTSAIKTAVEDAIDKAKTQFEKWFTQMQYNNARVATR